VAEAFGGAALDLGNGGLAEVLEPVADEGGGDEAVGEGGVGDEPLEGEVALSH
jgi:hypothetical protein